MHGAHLGRADIKIIVGPGQLKKCREKYESLQFEDLKALCVHSSKRKQQTRKMDPFFSNLDCTMAVSTC